MEERIELQNVLHIEIPITRRIGIQVEHCDSDCIILTAPLDPNINHKCTAFGGSLYSVAVLAGWSLIYYNLKHHHLDGHIVIQHSDIDYIRPVEDQIRAECRLQKSDSFLRFLKTYQRKGRARISLQVNVISNNAAAVVLNGQYVVHK